MPSEVYFEELRLSLTAFRLRRSLYADGGAILESA